MNHRETCGICHGDTHEHGKCRPARISHEEARHALMELVDVDKAEHVSVLQRFLMQQQAREAEQQRVADQARGLLNALMNCDQGDPTVAAAFDRTRLALDALEAEHPAAPEPQPASPKWQVGDLVALNDRGNDKTVGIFEVRLVAYKDDHFVYQLKGRTGLYSETFLESAVPEPQPPETGAHQGDTWSLVCVVCGGDGYDAKGQDCRVCKGRGKRPPAAAEPTCPKCSHPVAVHDGAGFCRLCECGGYLDLAEPTPPDAVDRPVMLSELVEALETIVNQGGILKAGSTGSWFGKLAEELARKAKGQAVMDHQVGSAEYWKERFLRCLSMLEKQQENNAEQFAQLRAAQAEVARLTAENEALRLEVTPRSTIEKIAIQRNIALAGLGLPLNAEPDAIHARVGATTLGAKQLWDLLDRVDSLGDELKPSDLKGYKKFYEISQRVAAKRHNVMTSDGYNLTWTEPTPKGDKEET